MKDFRLHLWDVFVYGAVGALAASLLFANEAWLRPERALKVANWIKEAPTSLVVIFGPAAMLLLGALLEPLANFYEKIIYAIPGVRQLLEVPSEDADRLEQFIKENYTRDLIGDASPYHLCKDFVESKQLSVTFMPFLARFGFYRSVSFLFASGAVWMVWGAFVGIYAFAQAFIVSVVALFCAVVYFKRSAQFFSYQRPAVFQAFLVPCIANRVGMINNEQSEM